MKNIFLAALLLLAVCSCEKSEPENKGIIDVDVKFAVEGVTKAPITTTSLPTSRNLIVSAYFNPVSGSGVNYINAGTFSYSSGSWRCSGAYWPLTGTLDMLGYSVDNTSHVSGVTWGSKNTASLTLTLNDNSAAQDDLVVGGGAALTSGSNALTFHHTMSLLTFSAYAETAYNATTNTGVTITDVWIAGAYHSGRMTCSALGTGITWDQLSAQGSMSLPSLSATHLTGTAAPLAGTPGLILPPQTAVPITVYYTMHNGKIGDVPNDMAMSYTFTPANWQVGGKYNYVIYVRNNGIACLFSAVCTDWDGSYEFDETF